MLILVPSSSYPVPVLYKNYRSVMYGFHSKQVFFIARVLVTDNIEDNLPYIMGL
jgi:hypothetical protein